MSSSHIDLRRQLMDLTGRLAAAGIDEARNEAWLLLAAATGRGRAELVAGALDTLSADQEARLAALASRRLRREPMAYILGTREFWSLPFEVSPAVLVPRPETEIVIETALETIADRAATLRILDLGTGSGCLLLALLSELPNARGLGVDRSAAALEVAMANAAHLGLADRALFQEGDWGGGLAGPFDLIVANPPYIAASDAAGLAPELCLYEPCEALFAGPDGLAAYRALAPDCARLLAEDGVVCLEIGQGQGPAIAAILERHDLRWVGSRADLAGIERCLILRSVAFPGRDP